MATVSSGIVTTDRPVINTGMDVVVTKESEVYVKVECDEGIAQELYDYFSFLVPGYQYTPQFKRKLWNGKIYLFQKRTHLLYHGLVTYLEKFCTDRQYSLHCDTLVVLKENFSVHEATTFIDSLGLPADLTVRPYQVEAVLHAIRNRRQLIVSPTGSGKSLMLYLLVRYFLHRGLSKVLLVVPTTTLVEQLTADFASYGWDVEPTVHKQYQGKDKVTDKPVTITTWQSIYQFPGAYFEQFDAVLGDECHLFTAKSLQTIMTSLTRTLFRIGTTGTLDGSKTNRLVLEGVFGPAYQAVHTQELQETGMLADLTIKSLVLKYDTMAAKMVKSYDYQQELDFIVQHDKRNRFITNLALSLEGNTLILYQYIDKHGTFLYNLLQKEITPSRHLFMVHGGVEVDDREEIRKTVSSHLIKDEVFFEFDTFKIKCSYNDNVTLSDGTIKKAKLITENDDIDASWILNNRSNQLE